MFLRAGCYGAHQGSTAALVSKMHLKDYQEGSMQ